MKQELVWEDVGYALNCKTKDGRFIGWISGIISGKYKFWFCCSSYSSDILRQVADKLDKMNKGRVVKE